MTLPTPKYEFTQRWSNGRCRIRINGVEFTVWHEDVLCVSKPYFNACRAGCVEFKREPVAKFTTLLRQLQRETRK